MLGVWRNHNHGPPMVRPVRFCRLPLMFPADDLCRDLAAIPASAWVAHFNAGYHDGGWSGVALRAPTGDAKRLFVGEGSDPGWFVDTPLLALCPGVVAVLKRLHCPIGPVRLLRLSAGGRIREHRDAGLSFEQGQARLHVPIITGDDVEFYLDDELVTMTPGECWYLDFDRPHRVQNLGITDRVHLVIDCEVNDWLHNEILTAAGSWRAGVNRESSRQRFERFRASLLNDPALIEALWSIEHPERLIQQILTLGRQRGMDFTHDDVAAAMRAGGEIGAGRWIVR